VLIAVFLISERMKIYTEKMKKKNRKGKREDYNNVYSTSSSDTLVVTAQATTAHTQNKEIKTNKQKEGEEQVR
jgi:hypothetical protein